MLKLYTKVVSSRHKKTHGNAFFVCKCRLVYGLAMPPSKPSKYRLNFTASGIFRDQLEFLREDTSLEDNSVIRLAVAELAKKRGFIRKPEPETRAKKSAKLR